MVIGVQSVLRVPLSADSAFTCVLVCVFTSSLRSNEIGSEFYRVT